MPGLKIFRILTALLPFLALAYVVWRSWKLVPFPFAGKIAIATAMIVLMLLVPVCMLPGTLDKLPLNIAATVYKTSLSWIFIMIYLLIVFVIVDILGAFHLVAPSLRENSLTGTLVLTATMLIVFVAGNINYHHKHREEININSEKPVAAPVKIVMLSDIHLGYHIRRAELSRWVDMVNSENPDLVLIAGDVIDRSIEPLLADDDAAELKRIKAPVFSCPGNHEYYAGIENSKRFYGLAGITMLRDTAVTVKGINVIGRDDRTNMRRKRLGELMKLVDAKNFTVLLDHQPFNLDEARQNGVDFELCGHTHYGQVWPVSWITDAMYEDAYGALQKGNTRYYVSSGIGIWGGKFRIGTRSEYVVMTIK